MGASRADANERERAAGFEPVTFSLARRHSTAELRPRSAQGAFLVELFLPRIHNLMLAYQDQKELKNDLFQPKHTGFSEGYYTKKLN